MFPETEAMIKQLQTVKSEWCRSPVATNTPAVNIRAPLGKKKQKNNPVCPYTTRNMMSSPPYLISDSGLKISDKFSPILLGSQVNKVISFRKLLWGIPAGEEHYEAGWASIQLN